MKQPDYEDGIPQMYRAATANSPEVRIPFRYDYQNGGFWLDYMPVYHANAYNAILDDGQNTHNILIHKHLHDMNPTQTGPPAEYMTIPEAIKAAKDMAAKAEVTEVFHSRHAEEREIKGVKAGLRRRKNKMSLRDFHEEHMHMGDCPGCQICILSMGTLRRIIKKVDPYKESRVCHTFHMDTITWSHRGFCGSKYEVHITCEASRWPDSLYLYSKKESLNAIEAWIIQMRLDPNFSGMPYAPVQVIVMDNAGEWDLDMAQFQEMGVRQSVEFRYTSKDRKESNARAERAIGVKEPKVKACLLQSNLPPEWVIRVSRQANWLLARFPPQSHSANCSPDGDKQLPLEMITRGKISRRMIYNQLYYFLNIGTPALVHDATIAGSRLPTHDAASGLVADCKSRWMVAYGMYRDQVVFWDPRTNDTCRSKSYTAFKLRAGMNFAQMIGCKMPKATEKSKPIAGDFLEKVVIQLPDMRESNPLAQHKGGNPVQGVKHTQTSISGGGPPTSSQNVEESLIPRVVQTAPHQDGGSVMVTDCNGRVLSTDFETGWIYPNSGSNRETVTRPSMQEVRTETHEALHKDAAEREKRRDVDGRSGKKNKPNTIVEPNSDTPSRKRTAANTTTGNDCYTPMAECYVRIERLPQSYQDKIEAHDALPHGYTTGLTDTFVRVCKGLKLPMEQHTLYRRSCILQHDNPYGGKLVIDDLPMEKNIRGYVPKLAPNWLFPYPTGSKWNMMLTQPDKDLEYERAEYVEALYAEVCRDIRAQESRNPCEPMILSNKSKSFEVHYAYTTLAQRQSKQPKVKYPKRRIRKGTGQAENWPNSVKQALASDKPEAWKTAIAAELDKLTDRGVFLHDQTAEDIIASGIKTKVVPLGLYLSEKYNEKGELIKEKARAAIKGHSGNMQKGVHYFETYAATPQPETARILICISLRHNWKRRAWDVELAYAWADLPVNERLALSYPKGCERAHPTTGEPLYIILLKNLYGDPAAGRRWSIHRDNKLLSEFNTTTPDSTEIWKCIRTVMDPCLFHITLKIKGHHVPYQMLISIHTDDLDSIGSDDIILEKFHAKANALWTLKETNPNFMLGIERIPEYDPDGTLKSLTVKMTAFVRGAVEAFKHHMPKRASTAPYPPKDTLTKDIVIPDEEIAEYTKLGYSRLIGMLLWAVRHGFDECRYGMSILGSVASKPGKHARTNAMYMLSWFEVNINRGIRWNENGNTEIIGLFDASDKALLSNGKRMHGVVAMWMDGPLYSHSSRLEHVGLSIQHNEYMALTTLVKKLVWLTQLLDEIGIQYQKPIEVFGDNVQANRLACENIITPGNQYIAHQYHFNKEKVEEGLISIHWVDTNLNLADIYTKPLTRAQCDLLMPDLLGYGKGILVLREKIRTMDPTCKPRPQ